MRIYEEGFSGLEASIVMIALIIVAVIFGMSVLNSGFIATEESKEQTVAGYKTASSSMYIEGAVYASLVSDGGALDKVWFSIGIPETGQPQDLSKMTIVYTHSKDQGTHRDYVYGNTADSNHFAVDGSVVMMNGDKRMFTLADVQGPVPGGWFTIEIKPQMGASTFVKYYLSDSFNGGPVMR